MNGKKLAVKALQSGWQFIKENRGTFMCMGLMMVSSQCFASTTMPWDSGTDSLNFHHYCRRIYASTGNLIHMMPLSDIWPGQKRCEHLGGPSLLYTRSDGATPFRLNLHVGDVGHTLVVGPTGAGKSVHLNMMSARKKGQLTDKSQLAFFIQK
jgi:hypothetical protein